jgi:hypothetical protein
MRFRISSGTTLGLTCSALLLWSGYIYGKFPEHWFVPVNISVWFLGTVLAITSVLPLFLGTIPFFAFGVLVFNEGNFNSLRLSKLRFHPVIAVPYFSFMLMSGWLSYWVLRVRPQVYPWTLDVLNDLEMMCRCLWAVAFVYLIFVARKQSHVQWSMYFLILEGLVGWNLRNITYSTLAQIPLY